MANEETPPALVGLAWYKPEQWEHLLEVSVDADQLEKTYGQWKRGIEKLERELRRNGIAFRRVYIDVPALVNWCRAMQRPIDGDARTAYVSLLQRQRHLGNGASEH